MAHTTHRDLRLAVELIAIVGAHPGAAAFAAAGVRELPRLVASDLTTLSVCTLRTSHRRVVCNPSGAISEGGMACIDRFFHEHPLVRYHTAHPDGTSRPISDSPPPRMFQRTGLHSSLYRAAGIDHAIAVPLFLDSSLLVSFVLNRKRRDFSERDRELLDLVRRPLAALYRNALALEGVQQALARVTTEGADDGWMLVSLDTARRVRGIAPRMEPWFSAAFAGARVGAGAMLPGALDRAIAGQFAAIAAALTIAGTPCEIEGRGCRCTVHVLWRGDTMRETLVLICRVGARAEAGAIAQPAAQTELTAREREVLQWVAAGKTNAQIADILTASPRTIGKHLENIYAKLGVETRTAAVNRGMAAL